MQESSKNGWFFVFCVAVIAGPQAGWVQGGSLKPPFLPLHTQPSYTISICKWPTSLTSIENHCCPKQVCSLRTSGCVQNAQLSSSCRCDEKTHVKKLLFQMLESSPFVLLVRHHQQWRYNWTTWSRAIFLKTYGNVRYKLFWRIFSNILCMLFSPSVALLSAFPTVLPSFVEIWCQLA